jgi:hypothetical protein
MTDLKLKLALMDLLFLIEATKIPVTEGNSWLHQFDDVVRRRDLARARVIEEMSRLIQAAA